MSRRRRKKRNVDVFSAIGKVLLLCLVVVVGFFMYKNYGDKILNKNNNATIKEEKKKSSNKQDETKKETTETTTDTKKEDKKDEKASSGDNKYTYKNQEGEKVTIKADKSVEATGFAGAGNHKYYLRGTTLYYKNISDGSNEVILAYNVDDLLLENKEVTAVLGKNGKVVVENNYIVYKNR